MLKNSGSKKKRNREMMVNPFADPNKSNPVAFSRSIRGYRGLSTQQHKPHLNNMKEEEQKIKIVPVVSSLSVKEERSDDNSSNIIAHEDEKVVVILVSIINFK